jgi:polyene glycosyltransferase
MKELGIDSRAYNPQRAMKLAEMILCFSLLELDYPFEAPDNLHTLGAMMPPLPETSCDGPVYRWLDAHESVVYVAFGTITRLTRDDVGAIVEVVRRLGDEHHVLWKLPTGQQRFLPNRLPSNLRVENWLPSQFDVLAHPHVRAYFNHGGSNSFHEGLYFGKPLLVWPLWLDCYDHAVRARDTGVGLTVDRSDVIDVADVYPKLRRLLDESGFRERAEYMARLQRQTGGVSTAADLILGSRALGA